MKITILTIFPEKGGRRRCFFTLRLSLSSEDSVILYVVNSLPYYNALYVLGRRAVKGA